MNRYDKHRRPVSRRSALLTLPAILGASCAGTAPGTPPRQPPSPGERPEPPASPPPEVSGAVELLYTGTFGSRDDFRSPWGISFGVDGTLYVCDRDRSAIVRLSPEGGRLSRYSGFGSRTERLYAPVDVCSTAGMAIYAIDAGSSNILRFDRTLSHAFPIFRKDSPDNELFGSFNGLAFDTVSGDLYVSDRDSGAIIRIDLLGKTVRSRGGFGSGSENLTEPAGLDVGPDGVLYIADRRGGAVGVLPHFGARLSLLGSDVLDAPVDAAVLAEGFVAAADRRGILVIGPDGAPAGRAGFGVDRSMQPRSLTFRDGRLYVSDAVSSSILVYAVTLP